MPPNGIFEASVVKVCQLNELTGFLNPWIITPLASRMPGDLHPYATVLLYAILEQGVTFAIYHLAIQPWTILLWAGPFHLYLSWFIMDVFQTIRHKEQRSLSTTVSAEDQFPPPSKAQNISLAFLLLSPFLTAALNNGTLVLFAQTLQAPSRLQQHPNVRILEVLSIVLFLGCRFADLDVWRRSGREGFSGEWRSFLVPLYCQATLFGVRALLRWIFGVSPLLGIQMMGPVEAEEHFGLQRYQWIKEVNLPKPPAWVLWVGPGLVFVTTLSSRLFLDRALKDKAGPMQGTK